MVCSSAPRHLMRDRPLVYLIAGEESGDLLGGALMAALKQRAPAIDFTGIGGARMIAQGLQPLFPMEDLSVMGLVEVLSHLPRLIRRIDETVADIVARKPDMVIGIDAPDFCFRVEKRVRAADPSIKLVHYVAPSVWAWRKGRARKIAAFLDHLLVLLPFEPPYFEAVGLPCSFIGHSAVEDRIVGDAARFRTRHGISEDKQIVLLLPGSRRGEVTHILPLCLDVARSITVDRPNTVFVFPTVPHVAPLLREGLAGFDLPCVVVDDQAGKADAFAAARAALAASGTVALELALSNVPAVICYRVTPISAFIAYRLIKLKYVSLANLILNREIMPEFLQERATSELVAPALKAVIEDTPERRKQLSASIELAQILKPGGQNPSVKSAEIIVGLISESRQVEAVEPASAGLPGKVP